MSRSKFKRRRVISLRTRRHIEAIKAEVLIGASDYLDRRAESLVGSLALHEYDPQSSEETWEKIYVQRWPERVKKATEEPAF
jgi:hypothetical protein